MALKQTIFALFAGIKTAKGFFMLALFIAILSVPLNIVDLPVNLFLLFIITILNAMIALFILLANAFIAIAINFPLLTVEVIVEFLVGTVNAVIQGIIDSLESAALVGAVIDIDNSKYIIVLPDFPRVAFLSVKDAMINFSWSFGANPWNGAQGSFIISAVKSGLPNQGIWQIAIVPTVTKLFGWANPFKKKNVTSGTGSPPVGGSNSFFRNPFRRRF